MPSNSVYTLVQHALSNFMQPVWRRFWLWLWFPFPKVWVCYASPCRWITCVNISVKVLQGWRWSVLPENLFSKPCITCQLACSPSTPSSLHYSSSHNSHCVNNCSMSTVSNPRGWEGFSTGGMAAACGKTGETGHVRHVTTPQRGAQSHLVTVSSLSSLLNHMLLWHSFSECTHCEAVSVSHLFVSLTSFSSSNYAVIVVIFPVG